MISTPRYFQVYIPLAILSCIVAGVVEGVDLAVEMGITNVIFGLNLWGGIWVVRVVVDVLRNPDSGGVLQFLVGLKFFLFISSIIVIFLAFGWVPVLLGNTLIVVTMILTALYFAIYPEEDM